jgi:transglutaminase-like putative cysteine protease
MRVKTRKAITFFAIFLLFSFALAVALPALSQAADAGAKAFDPKNAGKTRLSIEQSWVLTAQKQLPEAVFITYGFPNTSFQTVYLTASDAFTTEKDEFGNVRLKFKWTPTLGKKTITLKIEALVDYSKASEAASTADAEKYSKQSKLVVLDSAIRAQASELFSKARDPQDDAEKMIIAAEWVRNVVSYDEPYWSSPYWNKDVNTSVVFIERRGVCREFAHLLQALLRANGIPARIVAGFVFSGEQWGAHAWVEAAIGGKWVALDPTFNEARVLDASHVKFAVGRDQTDLTEEVTSGISVVKQAPSVKVVETQNFKKDFTLKASGPSSVGQGALGELTASLSSNSGDWLAVPLAVKAPSQPSDLAVSIVEFANKLVYLKPGELRKAVWTAVFPKSFKQGLTYEFPFSISSLGQNASFAVKGSVEGQNEFERLTVVSTDFQEHGAFVSFTIRLKNSGSVNFTGANASADLGGEQADTQFFSLPKGSEKELVFRFGKPSGAGVYRGLVTILAGRSELRQPIELTVEQPSFAAPSVPVPSGLEQYLIPALVALALLAIALVLLAKRRKRKPERGLNDRPVRYYGTTSKNKQGTK